MHFKMSFGIKGCQPSRMEFLNLNYSMKIGGLPTFYKTPFKKEGRNFPGSSFSFNQRQQILLFNYPKCFEYIIHFYFYKINALSESG